MATGTMELLLILTFVILGFVVWLRILIDCHKRPDDKFAIGGNNAKLYPGSGYDFHRVYRSADLISYH